MESSAADSPSIKDEKQLEEMETDEDTASSGMCFVIPSFKLGLILTWKVS